MHSSYHHHMTAYFYNLEFLHLWGRTDCTFPLLIYNLIFEKQGRTPRYLLLPPTRQDLTLDQWPKDRLKWGLGEGNVGHEPRLDPCWTMTQLAYLKVVQPKQGALRPQVCFCWTVPESAGARNFIHLQKSQETGLQTILITPSLHFDR